MKVSHSTVETKHSIGKYYYEVSVPILIKGISTIEEIDIKFFLTHKDKYYCLRRFESECHAIVLCSILMWKYGFDHDDTHPHYILI